MPDTDLTIPEYIQAPTEELLDEAAADPTFPGEAPAPKRGRGQTRVLTRDQQNQIALWIVEGYTYPDAKEFMERDWGFSVSKHSWTYYRTVRTDLLDQASKFIAQQYLRFGYSDRGIRIHKLMQHAQRLEHLIAERGLYWTDTKLIGGGRNAQVVSSEQFDRGLSQEYRQTIEQIEKMYGPVESRLKAAQDRMTVEIDVEQAQRFLVAANAVLKGSQPEED